MTHELMLNFSIFDNERCRKWFGKVKESIDHLSFFARGKGKEHIKMAIKNLILKHAGIRRDLLASFFKFHFSKA
jgi:hypothetical protein